MKFNEIKQILSLKAEFRDFDDLVVTKIDEGIVSKHKYKIKSKNSTYFVKEIKDNEKNILKILDVLRLDFYPKIIYSDLLDKNILVSKFVSGGILDSWQIDDDLLIGFTEMQNILNDIPYLKEKEIFDISNYSESDGGFFRSQISDNFANGLKSLIELKKFSLLIVNKHLELITFLEKDKNNLIDDFSKMPFVRQHHDFKQDNIIGKPQKLTDWGSSYGYGPFLFDLAPFLLNDKNQFVLFKSKSDICRNFEDFQINRWLYVAAVARYVEDLRYRISDNYWNSSKEKCEQFLKNEYNNYQTLHQIT